MLIVLPDSNALFGRLVGTRPSEDLLAVLALSSSGEAQFVLPEIVQWEIANQAQREIAEQVARYRAAGAKLRRLEIEAPTFNEGPNLGKERVALATEELRKTILSCGGRIAPIPNVSHAELVRRSLDHRRPFDTGDRGYRDTLLWHTALELLREHHSVVLVSNDKAAFVADGKSEQLHADLAAELRAFGVAGELRLARNFNRACQVVEEMASPARKAVKALLRMDEIAAEVMHLLCTGAQDQTLEGEELRYWGWSKDLAGVRVEEIKDFGGLRAYDAVKSSDGKLKAQVKMEAIAELDTRSYDVFGDGDLDELEDLAIPGPIHDVGVGLTDWLLQAYVDRELTLAGEIEISESPQAVASVSLTGIELPRKIAREGQLALGFPFNDLTDY